MARSFASSSNRARASWWRKWAPTIVGGVFLVALVATLFTYDNVVFESGPEVLVGRPVGAACTDTEQCSAPLGSATRRASPKLCVVPEGGLDGVCRRACGSHADCAPTHGCVEATARVDHAGHQISTHACLPR